MSHRQAQQPGGSRHQRGSCSLQGLHLLTCGMSHPHLLGSVPSAPVSLCPQPPVDPCTGHPEGRHRLSLNPQTEPTLGGGEHGSYSPVGHPQPRQGCRAQGPGAALPSPHPRAGTDSSSGSHFQLNGSKERKKPNLQPAEAAPPDHPLISED